MTGIRWTTAQHEAFKASRAAMVRESAIEHPKPVAPPKPKMNKTEARYAAEFLAPQKHGLLIKDWGFERLRIYLGNRTWYWPDFDVVELNDSLTLVEVKGAYVREDAWIKLKIAASMYPHFNVVMAQYIKGQWIVRKVPS